MTMPTSINPYGYAPSLYAVLNPAPPQEDQTSAPTQASFYDRASIPPKSSCPLLAAPYEIRAQITTYILPCTIFSREKEVIWLRGNTAIMATCRKMYEECRGLLYGGNWFLIDIHFDLMVFNYQWLIVTDFSQENYGRNLGPEYKMRECSLSLIPSSKIHFVDHFSTELRGLMKKFVVRMHFVDSYDGMIKYNTTNEYVLRMGLITIFEEFKERTLPNKDTGMPLMMIRLLGDKTQITLFRTLHKGMMDTIYPGWLSSLSSSH